MDGATTLGPTHRIRLIRAGVATLIAALPVVLVLPHFFRWLDTQATLRPPEPLLQHLPAMDLSVPLFVLIYGAVLFTLVLLLGEPARLVRAMQAYVLLLLLRMVAMALVTLEPPPGLVSLHDPLIQVFYPGSEPFAKDLFFSGHVATTCLLAWAVPGAMARALLACAALLVALGVLLQHIHWTVDVLAAPFFAWAAWRMAQRTFQWTMGAR
jgi:hypothetical protein